MNDNLIQQYLEQYHQLATELRTSGNIDQLGPILEPLVNIALTDQIAYLKALGQEKSTDAADVAQAIYNLAPDKEVRKEARRTLLRLESQDLYPQWKITPDGDVQPTIIEIEPEHLPMRQESGSTEKMPFGLEAIFQEITDFLHQVHTSPTVQPVTALLESWAEGDLDKAYNALSPDSALREGLDIETWAEHRAQWLEAANTGSAKITYVGEKEKLAPDRVLVEATWSLPIGNPTAEHPPKDLPTATCILKETGRHWFWTSYIVVAENEEWHITDMIDEGARVLQLPREEIEKILDEKTERASQQLEDLEDEDEDEDFEDLNDDEDFEDEDEDFEDFDEDDDEDEDEVGNLDFLEGLEMVIREATQSMHYYDSLIRQEPGDDPDAYEAAVESAQLVQDVERSAAYFQQMAQDLPEARGKALRSLAIMYKRILRNYLNDDPEDLEPEMQRYRTLIEETLRQAIEADQAPRSLILLADVFIQQNNNLDEAETLLKTAQTSATDDEEIVGIEAGLAQIAQIHNQKEDALQHYQTVGRLDTDFPHIWFHIGTLQRQLGQIDEATFNLRRNIREEPDFVEPYIELSVIYSDQKQFNKARNILRKGLDEEPDEPDLLASMSIVYAKSGDLQSAQRYLRQAEMVDEEENPFVPIARTMLQAKKEEKSSTPSATHKGNQPNRHSHRHKKK